MPLSREHHRRIQHAAGIVADLIARPGPGREVAIAGAIDEDVGAHRLSPGFCFHHQRVDAAFVMHHHAGAKRMKQDIDLVGGEQIVGRDLVGRGVIGLRQNLSENEMWRIQPAETIHARQQIGRDALHHPMHLAIDIGMQPAEIRHPGRRPHAAEESIALDQQRAAARACGRHGRGDARGSAAEDCDFVFAVEGFGGRVLR
jgi:hypothetical protein